MYKAMQAEAEKRGDHETVEKMAKRHVQVGPKQSAETMKMLKLMGVAAV